MVTFQPWALPHPGQRLALDREAERDRHEGVCQHDLALGVQDHVPGTTKGLKALGHVVGGHIQLAFEVVLVG